MSMEYIRKTYGVPCRRGVSVRAWFGDVWRGPMSSIRPIASASNHVHPKGGGTFHPLHRLEYIDADGFRLWPITAEEFTRADLTAEHAKRMNPTRPAP
jgi:hypothetical protein